MLMMRRDESFGWNEAEVLLKTVSLFFFSFFFCCCCPLLLDFRAPLPPLCYCQKIIASLATVSLRFQGAATIQLLCLPLQMFQWRCSLVETPFLSLSLSVPLEERHLLHYFFPSDDTCGRIREQDRRVGGPLWIHRLIYFLYSCWTW